MCAVSASSAWTKGIILFFLRKDYRLSGAGGSMGNDCCFYAKQVILKSKVSIVEASFRSDNETKERWWRCW
jgi:hypothetical protein